MDMIKKSRAIFALASLLVIIFLMHTIAQVPGAKADSNQPLIFSSGLTLYSPVNTTYSSNVLECNGTFDSPKGVQSSLNYSLDGKEADGLPWKFDPNSIANIDSYTIDGSFQLPQLSDGTHQLSIGILEEQLDNFNINSPSVINSTSTINTVYFSISTTQPSNPTPTPIPTVPEFSWLAILPLFISLLFIAIKLRHRSQKTIG